MYYVNACSTYIRTKTKELEDYIARLKAQLAEQEAKTKEAQLEFSRFKEEQNTRPEVRLQSEINLLTLEKVFATNNYYYWLIGYLFYLLNFDNIRFTMLLLLANFLAILLFFRVQFNFIIFHKTMKYHCSLFILSHVLGKFMHCQKANIA